MYTLSSNDCLIKNCRANDGRHNYDFKYPYSNGNVIHNCKGENSKYASDFHMYLSMSNLFDLFTLNKDYLESTFRPYGGSAIHGYSSTQSVFYNTIGEAYHPQHNYVVESKQFGWGYIIGTSGPAFNINVDPAEGSINNYKYNSAPKDFTEGINKGGGLRPQSLYLDQLEKRLNNGVKVQTYNVRIIVKDEKTFDVLPGCKAKNFEEQKITDDFGIVSFDKVPGMLVLSLEKDLYKPLVNKQIIVYSDTILIFFLSKKEYNVIFKVLDNTSKNIIWDAQVKVDEMTEQTDNRGEAVFKVYEGIHKYTVGDELYKEVTGWVNITSDTLINVYLTQSLANVKFRLKEGTAPVNNAIVRLNTDSLISNALGIVNFYNLSIGSQFTYSISKQGYYYVEGGFLLSKDTTIDISMKILDVSAQAVDNNKEFKYWPNPVRDNLNILLSGTEFNGIISVTNLNGEKLSSLTVKNSNSINLDVSFLPVGIYLIKVVSDNEYLTKLFIKI